MENKNKFDSHLNKRNSMAETKNNEVKVQTDNLTQPVVKLPHVDYENASPYSVLTKEFAEQNVKSSVVPFEVNTAEFVNKEVKLPTVETIRSVNVQAPCQEVKDVEQLNQTSGKEGKVERLPDIPDIKPIEKLDKDAERDLMQKLSQLPSAEEVKINTNLNVKLSKEVEEFKVKHEENVQTGMDVLNELQATEQRSQTATDLKGDVQKATNSLEDLLSSLDDEEGTSGTIGMG